MDDLELIFVIGVVIVAFGFPSLVSAFASKRFPRLAVLMLIVGGGMIYYVVGQDPENYGFATIDDALVSVIGRYVN